MYEISEVKDGAALIDMGFGRKYWIDTNDLDEDFEVVLFEDAVATDVLSDYRTQTVVPGEDTKPEFQFLQSDPEVLANMDVNPNEIARYGELQDIVIEGRGELQETGEKELLAKVFESMALLKDIFGYTVEFHEDYDVAANVELAMEQVHNLATILYHFLNDLGYEIMRSTPEETTYILEADERIPKYQGLVVMPESTAKGNPELKIGLSR